MWNISKTVESSVGMIENIAVNIIKPLSKSTAYLSTVKDTTISTTNIAAKVSRKVGKNLRNPFLIVFLNKLSRKITAKQAVVEATMQINAMPVMISSNNPATNPSVSPAKTENKGPKTITEFGEKNIIIEKIKSGMAETAIPIIMYAEPLISCSAFAFCTQKKATSAETMEIIR